MPSVSSSVIITGMHGLGDNLHQRAVVRAALQKGATVWLETPWPSVYHDLPVKLLRKLSDLRTQRKNILRESSKYSTLPPVMSRIVRQRVWYTHDEIRKTGSFLAAMAANCGVTVTLADIRLPIAEEWDARLDGLLRLWRPTKPLMFFRPLVQRTEWVGSAARNPDPFAYTELVKSIRDRYFVISIADLEPGKEWLIGEQIAADVTLHAGELPFELLAALAARSSLVFASPGFAIILAQAVGAKLVAVFGGHESSQFYNHGDPDHLWIDPVIPCSCFSKHHACNKHIDLPKAVAALKAFAC